MLLRLENLSKSYGKRRVLHNLCFEIGEGARLGVWGPNGAGKSTLLRLLCGLERADGGTVELDGFELGKEPQELRRRMGVLGHSSMLYGDLSALENLELYGNLYAVADCRARALELLQQLGLGARREDPVKSFSQGMRQRVALGRALMHDPELLLLDEPFSGLDAKSAAILLDLLQAQSQQGRSLIMVSHDAKLVSEFCSHVLILGLRSEERGVDGRKLPAYRFVDLRDMEPAAARALLEEGALADV